MRIAYDHQVFGFQKYGGISRYICELAFRIAASEEHAVAAVAPLYVNAYLRNAPAGLVRGIPVPWFPKCSHVYGAATRLLSSAVMRRFDPDVVHETYYSTAGMRLRKPKIVLTVYDMIHEKFSDGFSRADDTRERKAAAVRRADHVICISERTRRDLIDLQDVDPAKTSVVHLGFSLPAPARTARAAPMPARPYILHVGNRRGYKNFERLVRAFASAADLRDEFDLMCFGGGAFTPAERRLVADCGVSGRVIAHSGDDAALERAYRGARLFVYPSLYEGFGIPPLEAMSFGCPVACSDGGAIPEIAGGAAEMFDPRDTDAMAHALQRVAYDDGLRRVLVERGYDRIQRFSWERCASETLAVYRRLAS